MDCISMGVMVAKVNTIVSFGDSFIYGSELDNNEDGSQAWPALIARQLDCNYKTMAVPGCSNEAIARQVFTYFSTNYKQSTLAVINWTWCMRWDFYLSSSKQWVGLGPTCVPDKLKNQLDQAQATDLIKFYNKYVNNSHEWNQFRSLQAIIATQSFLKLNKIKNIQTYMDRELFWPPQSPSRLEHYNAYKDDMWPNIKTESDLDNLPVNIRSELDQNYADIADPDYIQTLQHLAWPELQDFDGKTFLDWSRDRGYPVTPPPGDHPLEQAHQAAAVFWRDRYQQLINE